VKLAREAHVAVGARQPQDERVAVVHCAPVAPVEAVRAAVERIRAVVRGDAVLDSVKHEARARDPIRVATADGAEVRVVVGAVVVERRPAEHDVRAASFAVGRFQRVQDRAEARDLREERRAFEHVEITHTARA